MRQYQINILNVQSSKLSTQSFNIVVNLPLILPFLPLYQLMIFVFDDTFIFIFFIIIIVCFVSLFLRDETSIKCDDRM